MLRLLLLLLLLPVAARAETPAAVVEGRMTIETPSGQGTIPVAVSMDWSRPLPTVSRVVIMVHGLGREADRALRDADQARQAAGALARTTLLVAPQFLTEAEANTDDLLRWRRKDWPGGIPALGPAPLSSFDVADAILARLADRTRFPALTHVVLAGHSSGGQFVQRYAAVGRGQDALAARGIALRHVVANPSSWLWFGDDRPYPNPACPSFNQWRYGPHGMPPYAADSVAIEARYLARDAVYLVGDADNDPNDTTLDRSCGAMTQGPHRFSRAMQFMFNLELRNPNLVYHRIVLARGVGHEADRAFASPCGLAALFERAGCPGLR